jgi:uncharacterized membrane protein
MNMGLFLVFAFLLAVVGGFYFTFPRASRRGLLFGVYVGEDASRSEEARRITRAWYLGMAAWLTGSIVLAFIGTRPAHSLLASALAVFLLPVGFLVEYLYAYRRARRMACDGAPQAAAAFISPETPKPPLLPYLAIGLGLAGGLYSIGYAWSYYPQLPDLVPTHFGLFGQPDAWKRRSVYTVMMLPIMNLILGVGLGAVSCLVGRAKRAVRYGDQGVSFRAQQRFRRIMSDFLAILAILTTALMTTLALSTIQVALKQTDALSPVMMVLALILLLFGLGGSITIVLKYGQGGSRLEQAAADAPLTNGLADNRLWVLGLFYVNRDDPSLFVERRFGFGYTINFGNPKAVALLVVFVGSIIVISILAALAR